MPDAAPSDLTRDALEREVTRLRAELRAKEREIDQLQQEIYDVHSERDGVIADAMEPLDRLHEALAALHEQAHGPTSIRFCRSEPCASVRSNYVGPAPVSLVTL